MGSLWGINRTMAQIHALLLISEEPLCANDIMAELQISRGNVSMALRELITWGIASRMHIKGERREFYTTEKDVWKMFRLISRERKKRVRQGGGCGVEELAQFREGSHGLRPTC